MSVSGIDHLGSIMVNPDMSGLEENPKDDWLYLGLKSFKELSDKYSQYSSAAIIGSANGIDAIALIKLFPNLKKLFVTDILPDILPLVKENIEKNIPELHTQIEYVSGRDCYPVSEKVDFIYGNLPLVMVEASEIGAERSTTTLTAREYYISLKNGDDDILDKYSLLSQLGFIISAKEKLKEGGSLVTLIGGRIPTEAIEELFSRAGVKYRRLFTSFMKQSDPEFLQQYAKIEKGNGVTFAFYDYGRATDLLSNTWNVEAPDIVDKSEEEIRSLLSNTKISAEQAYELYKNGEDVGHLAYAFHVTV